MLQPNNYNETQSYKAFEPIKAGGHKCIIMKVEEKNSSAGKAMINVYLDTAKDDIQPNYFENQYKTDTRATKKWGCIVYQLVLDAKNNTHRGFKTFIEAVENSNNGFKVVWGDKFADCFKGKLVGGVFGAEEYCNNYGEIKTFVKCTGFRNIEGIEEVPAPKLKKLDGSTDNGNNEPAIVPIADFGDMPF